MSENYLRNANAASTSLDLHKAEARIKELEAEVGLWREYEQFLFDSNRDPITLAHAHGWRCSPETFARGEDYRRRLGVWHGEGKG